MENFDTSLRDKIDDFLKRRNRKKELSKWTRQNYFIGILAFQVFLESHSKSILDCTVNDFDAFVDFMLEKYARSTTTTYTINTRAFLIYLYPEREEEYKKIQLPGISETKITAKDLITPQELIGLIDATKNPRDKALISFLADTGCRRSEVLSIKLKNIKDEQAYIEVFIPSSKTESGLRSVYLRGAAGYLRDWLNIHPNNKNPDAFLFCSTRRPYGTIDRSYVNKIIKTAAEDAGLRKIYPHLFRHTKATELFTIMSQDAAIGFGGWSKKSNVYRRYSHLTRDNVLVAWKRAYNIPTTDDENISLLEPITCPRCKYKNTATSMLCGQCGLALSDESMFQQIKEEKSDLKEIMKYFELNKHWIEIIPEMAKTIKLLKEQLLTSD